MLLTIISIEIFIITINGDCDLLNLMQCPDVIIEFLKEHWGYNQF